MSKIIFILSTILLLVSCDEAGKQKEKPDEANKEDLTIPFDPPEFEQEFLESLYLIQMDIMKNPSSLTHKEKYISDAYIADRNTLVSFGNARNTNPETGTKIAPALVKRAAILDAKRWATYGLIWLNNNFEPDFGKIKDVYNTDTKEITSFNKGDSLIIAIASKVK